MSDNLSFTQSLREEGFIIADVSKNKAASAGSASSGATQSMNGTSYNMIAAAIIVIALVLIMIFVR